jgi:acyl dehydratase
MIDKSIVGRQYPPFSVEVEKRWLRSFAQAIGLTDPVYVDEAAAHAAGYRSLPAAPTFAFAILMEAGQSFKLLEELGIDKRRAMHAEQSFTYQRNICAGDVLSGQQQVVDVYDKKGGALEFLVTRTRLANAAGEPVCELRTTVVVRN